MTVLHRLRGLLNSVGLDAHRYNDALHNLARRLVLTLDSVGATTVIDVGAHRGEFAASLLTAGFTGRIISFEPDQRSFPALASRCAREPRWSAVQLACSDETGEVLLHLSTNEVSSSLQPATELHVRSAPSSAQVASQVTRARRLDEWMLESGTDQPQRTFVKIDAQGSELAVLHGLGDTLGCLAGLQLEVSFQPLYESGANYLELLQRLDRFGFVPCSVAPVFMDPSTGVCLQADMTFIRPDAARIRRG